MLFVLKLRVGLAASDGLELPSFFPYFLVGFRGYPSAFEEDVHALFGREA